MQAHSHEVIGSPISRVSPVALGRAGVILGGLKARRVGVRPTALYRSPGSSCQGLVPVPEEVEVALRQLLQVQESVVGPLHRADQLVELELHGDAIAILGVLDFTTVQNM